MVREVVTRAFSGRGEDPTEFIDLDLVQCVATVGTDMRTGPPIRSFSAVVPIGKWSYDEQR